MSIFVNQVEISEAEVGQEMQYHPAPTKARAWQLAAQSLVIRQLLLQQAVKRGLCEETGAEIKGEQEEQLIDRLLQQDVIVPEADEASCRRYYDNHPDSFRDKKSGDHLTFDQAWTIIRDYLHAKAMRIAVAEYIKALSYQAEIKGVELEHP